jgi:ribose transport system substrate-binding protein
VGVTLGTLDNPYFVAMANGAKEYAEEHHAQVYIESADYDLAKQTQQIEDFITKGVDLILLNAADTKGIAGAVQEAKNAGIPVIAVDVEAEGGVNATITSDNYQAGKLAGDFIKKKLGGKGNVAIINGPPVSSIIDRVKGFKDAIKGTDIKVVADQNGGAKRGPAQDVSENILEANPKGTIDAIFGINDPSSLGAVIAAQQNNRHDFFIASVDGSPDAITEMKKDGSLLAATAAQNPSQMIKKAFETGIEVVHGKKVPSLIKIPVELITKDNVNQYEGWLK